MPGAHLMVSVVPGWARSRYRGGMLSSSSGRFGSLVVALGESDCEEIGSGFLAQPVNAVTSLAFTIVGLAMIGWARVADGREHTMRWLFVLAMAATGVGSFLYHGPQWAGSGFLHDITFLSVLAILVVADVAAARRWRDQTVALVLIGTVALASVILIVAPDITNVLTGIGLVLLVVSDLMLFGRTGRGSPWYLSAVGMFALALVTLVLGRTGSPSCAPGSILQYHGLWHLLAAGALGAYAVASGERRASLDVSSIAGST